SVPLQVQLTDSDVRINEEALPEEVQVRLNGPVRDLIEMIFFRRPPLVLQVGGVESRVETRPLTPSVVEIPAQVMVHPVVVRPSALRLECTQSGSRSVPVRPRARAELGDDFAIVDTLQTEPAAIQVTGPLERLEYVTEILTQPFDL